MDSTFEDQLNNLEQTVEDKHNKICLLKRSQTKRYEQKENLIIRKLDLNQVSSESEANISTIEAQISKIQLELDEIEKTEHQLEAEIEQEINLFNFKIREETEKAIQKGKKDKKSLFLCASRIMEYDSRFENKSIDGENTEELGGKCDLEIKKQEALIKVAFGINKMAGQFIGKELKEPSKQDESLAETEEFRFIKISHFKFAAVHYKNGQIIVGGVQKMRNEAKYAVCLDSDTKLVFDNSNCNPVINLQKQGNIMDQAKFDFLTFKHISKSNLEENLFFFSGVKIKCESDSNKRV